MKLLFANQYYWPDPAATAQMLVDLCEHLAERGHEVHVLCSRGIYDQQTAGESRANEQVHNRVHIHRIWATNFGKKKNVGQLMDFLTFHAMVGLHTLFRGRRFDVVIPLTTPPLIGIYAGMLRKLFRVRHVSWVMDLHPDCEFELGVIKRKSLLGRFLDYLNTWQLRSADTCVALGECMAKRLREKKIPKERIETIAVWGHDEVGELTGENPLRKEFGLEGKIVIMYSGNAGVIHTFDEICQAALRLKDDERFVFLFIGGGRRLPEVREFAEKHSLNNIRIMGYVPREQLKHTLTLADVHYVSLRANLAGISVPCKLYGIMAAAKPAIFVGPAECESVDAINRYDCGYAFPAGEVDALVQTIQSLADDPGRLREMQIRARQGFEQTYNAFVQCEKWRALLERRK